MKTLSSEMTIGEIAARFPNAARIFDQHHIDFCCGGGIVLDDACRARGLNPADVLEQVQQSGTPAQTGAVDWQTAPLGQLIDFIVGHHHEYLKTELPRLQEMLAKVLRAHGERHGDVLRPLSACFLGMKEELESHLAKEETAVFPVLRSLETPGERIRFDRTAANVPIHVLITEHDSAGEALAEMRRLTSNYRPPEDGCNTYRALYLELDELDKDLRQHVHLENNILFPRALGARPTVQ